VKIDIHVHTRKTKQGDAPTREVSAEKFSKIVQSTDVKIIAITNHNVFDLEQFNQIEEGLDGAVQIWPGIELDVVDEGKRSHLIVIVSPQKRDEFSGIINHVTEGQSADQFTISLEDTVEFFEKLEPLYVAHYLGKKPDMSEASIEKLLSLGINPKRVIKEATNSISAGIFIAHGHTSIYGSDIQDWDKYTEEVVKLPELRLSVDSFEHFCLLLEKDVPAIDTAIDRKHSEVLTLQPFEDETKVKIRAFNDINIIFGPKGTGKTKILEAIAKEYSNRGIKASVFESAPDKLADRFDIRGKNIEESIDLQGIDCCRDEINRIRKAKESDITSLYKYREFFNSENKNKNAKKMKIKDLPTLLSENSASKFNEYKEAHSKVLDMVNFLKTNSPVDEVMTGEERTSLIYNLNVLSSKLKNGSWELFTEWKSAKLTDSASQCFRNEVTRKTGERSKPSDTGFKTFATNRLNIGRDTNKIIENISKNIKDKIENVGVLGPDKGLLKCATSFQFQNGNIHESKYLSIKSIRKQDQKEFVRVMRAINDKATSDDLFDSVTELNAIVDIDKISSLSDLLLFWRRFTLSGEGYSPSNGECSMLNLHSELAEDKEIYLLDEPERSLGNEYINDVIIPLINDKAIQGKMVFISTHDANVAVRTLPYNSIYRCHDKDGYSTYTGNPFSNSLICLENTEKTLDWKQISMKTLEGGQNAFGERGKIYGNN
jgi:predicted ATPase